MKTGMEQSVTFNPNEYTILIVDDNPKNLSVIDKYLKAHRFKTLIASKGELALKRVKYGHPDLILLDVMMPGIDGFETCRRLKADEQTRDVPVIFMTALTDTEYKVKGFEVGAVDYITKPFQQKEVLARVTTHLRIRRLTQSLREEIIERKRAEAALREAHEEIVKLEKEALEIQMAGGFAHEMRNALTGIMLVLHPIKHDTETICEKNVHLLGKIFTLLEQHIPEKYWDELIAYFSTIEHNEEILNNVLDIISNYTSRAMEVTTLIFNYAKLGSTEIGKEEICLKPLIESIVQEHDQEFRTQSITLRPKLSLTTPLVGNPAHFYMMINNIVLNARDALLEVGNERECIIDITLTEEGQTQIITITDNANGISEDHLPDLFKPFFSTKPATGTGLGLSFVSKLVSLYYGTIDVDTEMDKGTTFTLTFPVQH